MIIYLGTSDQLWEARELLLRFSDNPGYYQNNSEAYGKGGQLLVRNRALLARKDCIRFVRSFGFSWLSATEDAGRAS